LGHEASWFFDQDGERSEQLVLQAFLDADSGGNCVFKGIEAKAEGGISIEHLVEELSALLDLQIIRSVKSTLVDCASEVTLFGLTFATAHEHVKCKHIMHCEFLRVHSLLKGFLVDDDLVAINEMLLQLVGQHSLHWVHLVGITDLLDDFSDLVVEVSGLEESECGLGGFVGSKDDISLLASDGGVLIGLHDDGVGSKGCEAIDMCSEFNLDEVSLLDVGGIFLERGIVAADFVDGDGGGEGESLEDWLFVIDLRELLVDLAIRPEAEFEDLGADCNFLE
jgi:hypothetical protein